MKTSAGFDGRLLLLLVAGIAAALAVVYWPQDPLDLKRVTDLILFGLGTIALLWFVTTIFSNTGGDGR